MNTRKKDLPPQVSSPTPPNAYDVYTMRYKNALLYLGQLEYNISKLKKDTEMLLNEREATLSSIKVLEDLIETTPRD